MQDVNQKIKVALINTSDLNGGAAIACYRLAEAMDRDKSINVKMIVKEKTSSADFVLSANLTSISKKKGELNFALEKGSFLRHEISKSKRFLFSHPNYGQDISKIKEIKEADILHLHWINKGFLSFDSLKKLIALNKPIVWTLHDMWPFTGGCHYSAECTNYQEQCGNCFLLKNPKQNDLSSKIWHKKMALFSKANLHLVTCSAWLKSIATTSSLLSNFKVQNIPNTIDLELYRPAEKVERKKSTILFQAMNINDKRKGLKYFLEALKIIEKEYVDFSKSIELVIFGKDTRSQIDDLSFDVNYLGLLKSQQEIIDAYHQSDLFVIPSLEDNLPNTIMEAMACGVPVVGFETGGIPEMVAHKKTGYIATQKDSRNLAEGIIWALENKDRQKELAQNARRKAEEDYAHSVVSRQYKDVYESILKKV